MPSLTNIICLSNLRKSGSQCIAGIEPTTGKWIRPISEAKSGHFERGVHPINGIEPGLGDILLVPLANVGPNLGFECENRTILPGPWSIKGTVHFYDLLKYCKSESDILHNSQNFVTIQYLQSLPFKERQTLQLVEVTDFKTFNIGLCGNGGYKWHATFKSRSNQKFTLSIEDPMLIEKLEKGYIPSTNCLLTISLSMPWKPKNWQEKGIPCWKLISGVIEIPSITQKNNQSNMSDFKNMGSKNNITKASDNELKKILKKNFGFHKFREFQNEVIQSILNKQDTFVVMPTGGGKSLCYQLPTLLFKGTSIVVTPLISQMKDQVDLAISYGLNAKYLNSNQSEKERIEVISKLSSNELDLLYISSEQFALDKIYSVLNRIKLSLFTIDEAHCISECGHDFRPEYLNLSNISSLFPEIPILAFTTAATHKVQMDIIQKLNMREPTIVRTSFDKPNILYRVVPKNNIYRQIIDFLKSHPSQIGIIYRTTRKSVEDTIKVLKEHGIKSLPYHVGLEKSQRKRNMELFNHDQVTIMVATIGYPIDIDKSNIRFVIHGDLPKNMENYYQETGRAGRDGEPAYSTLFYKRADIPKVRYFINQISDSSERQRLLKALNAISCYANINTCRRRQILSYFGENYHKENCGACDICLGEVEEIDATTDAQLIISIISRTGQCFGPNHIVDIITGVNTDKIKDFHHNELKYYGMGKSKNKKHWWQVIDNLIAQKFLVQIESHPPILKLTPKASIVLKGVLDIYIIRQKKNKETSKKIQKKDIYTIKLFEKLRILRRRIASVQNVPPYIIFSDRTLHEMANYLPTTEQKMLSIIGVGETKMKRYGQNFLKEIKQFKEKYPDMKSVKENTTINKDRFLSLEQIRKKSISESINKTWKMLEDELTLDQISSLRGLTIGSIIAHIERLILSGKDIDINKFVSIDKQLQIEELFYKLNTDILSEIVNASKGSITYDEARLVRALLKKAGHM